MSDTLTTDLAEAGGWSTVAGTLFLSAMELMEQLSVNDVLHGILLLGSIVFLYYKIANSRLDAKIKKRQLDEESSNK